MTTGGRKTDRVVHFYGFFLKENKNVNSRKASEITSLNESKVAHFLGAIYES